jgi:hypothetical protein
MLENSGMSPIETIADSKEKLAEVIAALTAGKRDPDDMRRAGEQMDRMREEIRRRIGVVNVAVDLIRDARK